MLGRVVGPGSASDADSHCPGRPLRGHGPRCAAARSCAPSQAHWPSLAVSETCGLEWATSCKRVGPGLRVRGRARMRRTSQRVAGRCGRDRLPAESPLAPCGELNPHRHPGRPRRGGAGSALRPAKRRHALGPTTGDCEHRDGVGKAQASESKSLTDSGPLPPPPAATSPPRYCPAAGRPAHSPSRARRRAGP